MIDPTDYQTKHTIVGLNSYHFIEAILNSMSLEEE